MKEQKPLQYERLEEEERMAWMALVGFASVLFTYLGVNYLDSLHSYF